MLEIMNFVQKHKTAVISVTIMLVCLLISGAITGGFIHSRNEAKRSLQNVQNRVTATQEQLDQPITKYKDLDHGYSTDRVKKDVAILEGIGTGTGKTNEWLSRFLNWSNGKEYVENRDWFVEKLGASNPFCTDIMREYDPAAITLDPNSKKVNDPNDIGCTFIKINPKNDVYVNSIDESTGVYNYVIFAHFNAKNAYSKDSFNAMDNVQCYIVTVSVDADGNVLPETFVVIAGPKSTTVY